MHNNALSSLPKELTRLTRLQQCWLAGNQFPPVVAGISLAVDEDCAKLTAKKFPQVLKCLCGPAELAAAPSLTVLARPDDIDSGESSETKNIEASLWIAEHLEKLEFEDAAEKREMGAWLAETFNGSTTWASSVLEAVDEIVLVAKVATVILKLTLFVVERNELAGKNDARVRNLCARLRELHASIAQVRDFVRNQARLIVGGDGASAQTASALAAPLQRVLRAVQDARDAVDAWSEVSRAKGADQWSCFKRWCARVVKSGRHADLLAAANDELQASLAQLGHVASLRAALSTASTWGTSGGGGGGVDEEALRQWLQSTAQRDAEFCAAVQQDSGAVKERVMQLMPEFDAVLARQLSAVHEKLDAVLSRSASGGGGSGGGASALVHLPHDSFTEIGVVGAGAYGVVKSKRCSTLGRQPVAVKELLLTGDAASDRERRARFQREAELLSSCNHQSIVRAYGVVRTPTNDLWLVTELLDVSLDRFIAARAAESEAWPFEERVRIASEIALGLEHLHRRGILHRDLKSANVMLNKAREAKLIDFGLSKDANDARSRTATSGTLAASSLWMAPEIRTNEDFCEATDVYAFGMVLAELLFAELPSTRTLLKVARTEERGEWRALIERCTEEEARKRPTATQCVNELNRFEC